LKYTGLTAPASLRRGTPTQFIVIGFLFIARLGDEKYAAGDEKQYPDDHYGLN
jgi:hypothetical protein